MAREGTVISEDLNEFFLQFKMCQKSWSDLVLPNFGALYCVGLEVGMCYHVEVAKYVIVEREPCNDATPLKGLIL
jgi:hypothetical protein